MKPRIAKHRRPHLSVAAAACALAAVAGCAQNRAASASRAGGPRATTREQAEESALRRLKSLAEAQAKRPDADALHAPPPTGLDAAFAQPLTAASADPKVYMPLADVVKSLAAQPVGTPVPRATDADPEAADSALRLYVSGRQKLLEGDAAGALKDLSSATTLDPTAGEPWRELGEAQLSSGSRSEAAASFQKAADRGLRDARVFELLGRWALERGEPGKAAIQLSKAYLASPEKADPLLPQVIGVALWRALVAENYIVASRDVLRQACERPAQLSSSTRYNSEYSAILRRMGDLWREIGDADCRLGDYKAAAEAYEQAAAEPSLEGKSLLARTVFALVRSGRPAQAAIETLQQIMETGGQADPESVSLLRYLAQTAGLSREIASALDDYRQSIAPPPSLAGGLARAQAAVAEPAQARQTLHRQVADHPSDLRSAVELFNLIASPSAVASQAASLCADRPNQAGRVAESLLRSTVPIDPLLAALAKASPRDAADLVLAYTEAIRGDSAKGAQRVAAMPTTSRLGPAVALARVELGLLAGNAAIAEQGDQAMTGSSGPVWARARARALAWSQRTKTALEILEPTLIDPALNTDERIDDLLLAGDLALTQKRIGDAERWYQAAANADPFDDRPAGKLLSLYSPGGPRPDPGKVNQLIRDLRTNMPESHALRAAKIKELVRRSVVAQAELDAVALANEDPADSTLIDLVTAIWKARADTGDKDALARGKAWFEDHLERRPRSPVLLGGLTTLLLTGGQPDEAASRLRAALDAGGGPDVSRLLERVLRDDLKKTAEADALTLARLNHKARSIGESLELAEVQARAGNDAQAASTISGALPADAALTPDQGTRLLLITSQIADHALRDDDQASLASAAGLFDLAVERSIKFSAELHQKRLNVLAEWNKADAAAILAASRFAGSEFPNLKAVAYIAASRALVQAKRGPLALEVISAAVTQSPDPDIDMFTEWCRDVAESGKAADAKPLIEQLERANKLRDMVDAASGKREGPPPKSWAAELTYILGNLFTAEHRPDEANAAYELALQYDPDHAWACNNLGYALADRGVDVDRAARLLERAHAQLPDEAPVTDSLGWLRYKQGVILDETDAAGNVRRQGAVSLLEAASKTDRGKDDPTILNHLGDALWLAGRPSDAIQAWELTEKAAMRILNPAGSRKQAVSASETQEVRGIKDSAVAKRRAASSGGDVAVAPQFANPSPKPPPSPGAQEPPARTGAEPHATPEIH